MVVYALSVFLSAFLLFQVQPMIGHFILPWFGGVSSVWSAAMLFFQVLLTGGYAYAFWLMGRKPGRWQGLVHGTLLGVSLAVVLMRGVLWPSPIMPAAHWKPGSVEEPVLRIFVILAVSIGLPYFLLASNSPLVQAWFARSFAGCSPYRLYALSNAGSLLALLSYPLVVEPLLTLRQQGWLWSGLYAVFASLTAFLAWRSKPPITLPNPGTAQVAPSLLAALLWLALSASGTTMLLAVTNRITQEIAPVPLLWVLPLGLYLLSFVLAFSGEGWYVRPLFSLGLALASAGVWFLLQRPLFPILGQVAGYLFLLFVACMIAHGELYRLRPEAAHLTRFYLWVSVGGALGGLWVNLLAPALFDGYGEFYVGWAGIWCLLALLVFLRPTELKGLWRWGHDVAVGSGAVMMVLLAHQAVATLGRFDAWRERNFYGVLRVREDKGQGLMVMSHGATIHGVQFLNPRKRHEPAGYYWRGSGIGLLLTHHPRSGKGMRVGIVGLGIGGLAAYAQPGDVYRFYEINPAVVALAQGQGGFFSFLQDAQTRGAKVEVVLGDARLTLERELQQGRPQGYDVLILDAFNSDSIPVHLLTRQAFELYLQHLAPEGMIVAHISNHYLDLRPVLRQVARHFGLAVGVLDTPAPSGQPGTFSSLWVLLTSHEAFLSLPAIAKWVDRMEDLTPCVRLWTDDYSNLFQVLKRGRG